MIPRLILFYILYILFGIVHVIYASDVIELTASNFDLLVSNSDKPWLIEFYAPWCGHCKQFAPTYEKLATKLKGSVFVGKIDGPAQTPLLGRFPIKGFPTIFSVRNGEVRTHEGSRTIQVLEQFAFSNKETPLGVFESPFGPIGKLKGFLFTAAERVMRVHYYLQSEYDLSPLVAALLLGSAGLVGTLSCALGIIWLFAPASYNGGEQPHPHQE